MFSTWGCELSTDFVLTRHQRFEKMGSPLCLYPILHTGLGRVQTLAPQRFGADRFPG